eukprot:3172815-Karenia_brevis.AAC.1
MEGDQHSGGAGRSDSLMLSPAGARGEIDLFGGATLMEATAVAAGGGAQQMPINAEDADLASGENGEEQSS